MIDFLRILLFSDNEIIGESFFPKNKDPVIQVADEIINGKLFKKTLSGDYFAFKNFLIFVSYEHDYQHDN